MNVTVTHSFFFFFDIGKNETRKIKVKVSFQEIRIKPSHHSTVPEKNSNIYGWTPSLIFVRHQSSFRETQNLFNQLNIYLYATETIFCNHSTMQQ